MKKPFIYLLTAGLAFSMIANTGTVDAAKSEATITFTAPDDAVKIVDPIDPSQPGTVTDLEDGNITGNTGPLTLDYVSHIKFGEDNRISSVSKDYYAETKQPYIQISDRSGSGNGWHVDVKASSFKDESGNILEGATLSLNNGSSISDSKYNAENNKPLVYDKELLANDEASSALLVNAKGKDNTGILNTAQGVGTWVVRWLSENEENSNVVLNVPGGVASSNSTYTSEIEWTLTDGPKIDEDTPAPDTEG